MRMNKVLREPFVHFVLIGLGLFVLFAIVNDDNSPDDDTILVSQGKIQNLVTIFSKTWQRPPNEKELQGLIEDHIKEEVFYREALRLGLDGDDVIIRRRMRQKMEFVAEDISTLIEPTEEELTNYLEEYPDKFEIPPRYSFRQVYISPEGKGEGFDAYCDNLLTKLRSGNVRDFESLSDPLMLKSVFPDVTPFEIRRSFGDDFTVVIEDLPHDSWEGPVRSGLGFHMVYIYAHVPTRIPDLEEVRPEVERELMNDRRLQTLDAFYEGLRSNYEVVIEEAIDDKNPEEAIQ